MTVSLDQNLIPSFHVHIYYDTATKHLATSLREEFIALSKLEVDNEDFPFGNTFSDFIEIGRMHDVPVGPHTKPMFYMGIHNAVFKLIVNHLMLHHTSLSVLIHPITGDELKDHSEYPLWLGTPLSIDLTKL